MLQTASYFCFLPGAVQNNQRPKSVNPAPVSWGFGSQKTLQTTFEFHQPTKVDRKHKK